MKHYVVKDGCEVSLSNDGFLHVNNWEDSVEVLMGPEDMRKIAKRLVKIAKRLDGK